MVKLIKYDRSKVYMLLNKQNCNRMKSKYYLFKFKLHNIVLAFNKKWLAIKDLEH